MFMVKVLAQVRELQHLKPASFRQSHAGNHMEKGNFESECAVPSQIATNFYHFKKCAGKNVLAMPCSWCSLKGTNDLSRGPVTFRFLLRLTYILAGGCIP